MKISKNFRCFYNKNKKNAKKFLTKYAGRVIISTIRVEVSLFFGVESCLHQVIFLFFGGNMLKKILTKINLFKVIIVELYLVLAQLIWHLKEYFYD